MLECRKILWCRNYIVSIHSILLHAEKSGSRHVMPFHLTKSVLVLRSFPASGKRRLRGAWHTCREGPTSEESVNHADTSKRGFVDLFWRASCWANRRAKAKMLALDHSPSLKDDDLLRQVLANDFRMFKLCGLEADDPEAMLQDHTFTPHFGWDSRCRQCVECHRSIY